VFPLIEKYNYRREFEAFGVLGTRSIDCHACMRNSGPLIRQGLTVIAPAFALMSTLFLS